MGVENQESSRNIYDLDIHVKVYHELMSEKIRDILLVSTPYDAFIMEEDGSLPSKIVNEYRGLNLSSPPRLTKASSGAEALKILERQSFDLVITMPDLADIKTAELVMEIRSAHPEMPVILLAHRESDIHENGNTCPVIDNEFIWTGNAELLLALVKSVEDRRNAPSDTAKGMVRVLILVEDSPLYRSLLLPLIYKVVVRQTVSLLEDSINEEHRMLKMRARPKILVAENYESAMALFRQYRPYVFGVISDTRYPRNCVMSEDAGFVFLSEIKKKIPHLPLLLLSTEARNRERAAEIQAVFIDKNSHRLYSEIEQFFLDYLGFGDFVFRCAEKQEICRASNLRELEKLLPELPDEPVAYHAKRHRFSNWLMARSEILLASEFAKMEISDFAGIQEVKEYIASSIRALRRYRQKGVIVQFTAKEFDPDIQEFLKIGKGSLGGKARGLAFISHMLRHRTELRKRYPELRIEVPRTLVIATDAFETFIAENRLSWSRFCNCTDQEVRERFLAADLPRWLYESLAAFLKKVHVPLSVRSSSLLEDAHVRPFTGLYKTCMIPNNHPDFFVRLQHLITAVKLVYASTYYEKPLAFARQISNQFQEDKMAVMIQQLVGKSYGAYLYPAISGTARSQNYYPVGDMRPEDGIAHICLGMGKILEEEEQVLRFSPRRPEFLPQFSTVEDILSNAQRYFYSLRIKDVPGLFDPESDSNLEKREIADVQEDFPVKSLCSTYIPEEHRIRDTGFMPGPKVMTFAPVLKYGSIPLPGLLSDLLDAGSRGIGGPAEIEFSVNLSEDRKKKSTFYFLQLRPMSADEEDLQIRDSEIAQAFCFSTHVMGHGQNSSMTDLVFVKPEDFDASATMKIAGEIGKFNGKLAAEKRSYLLAGPGRWGSSDRWLGIPVRWKDICAVGAMIEMRDGKINADASYGTHFFQKITAQGIHYITLDPQGGDRFEWEKVRALPIIRESTYLCHVRAEKPFILKNDGRSSRCVLYFV